MQKDQYHHYIPRFILRNFAINNHERIFVSNGTLSKKQKQRFKETNKKDALLQVYYINSNQFDTSPVSKTYGNINMYKDFNHENVMRVEDKLSKLEMQASDVIRNIVNASQNENQVVLSSTSLNNLRKFLFIMNYRKPHRQSQYINQDFDLRTWPLITKFMQDYKIQHTREVWLQNIREILDTTDKDIRNNLQIFSPEKNDYMDFMMDRFLVIWQAGENDEFITTSNGFGIYDGINGLLPSSKGHYAIRYYYIISPKLVLVLCSTLLREEFREFRKSRLNSSFFNDVPHPEIPKLVKINNESDGNQRAFIDSILNSLGFKIEECDTLIFPIVKVNSATVHLVNTIILNETMPDEVFSFRSQSNLYKSIIKYHNSKDLDTIKQDHTSLKKKLFIVLNRTHQENLSLRKILSANYRSNWKECKILQNSDTERQDQLRNNTTEILQNSNPDLKVRDQIRDNLTEIVQDSDPERQDKLRNNITEILQNSNPDLKVRDQLRDNLTEIVRDFDPDHEVQDQVRDSFTGIDKLHDNFTIIFQNSDPEKRDQLQDNLVDEDLKLLMDEFRELTITSPNPAIRRWAIQEYVMRKKGLELNRKVNNKEWPNPYVQCLYKGPFDNAKIPVANCRCNSCVIYRKFNGQLNEHLMSDIIKEQQRLYKVPKTLEPNKDFLIEMYFLKDLASGYEPSYMPLIMQCPNTRYSLMFAWPKHTSNNFSMGNCASIFNLLRRDWMITEHFVKAKDLFARYPFPESVRIRISYKIFYEKYLHVYALGFHESFGDPAKYEFTTTLFDFKKRFQNSDLIFS
ncbi:22325_t:CDS:1 [Dentiscutata erythropus]|uniref:22325_t:CDS:1 n=1 Tax=Dentiscutata erythropus TaxID=1348616 RepID=A0A9N9I5U2_9GLOM|nr:22325_t:CDS:1 [Dentiscutata erythropus]